MSGIPHGKQTICEHRQEKMNSSAVYLIGGCKLVKYLERTRIQFKHHFGEVSYSHGNDS